MNLAVILVSPKGAGNVGGVARLMGNFGVKDLRLVDPRCDLGSVECKQMAMHSYDIIRQAKIFSTMIEAQEDLRASVALSARTVGIERPHSNLFPFAESFFTDFRSDEKVGLVFGREESGLRLEELARCDWQISIPTSSESTSINLTSAAAITLGTLFCHSPGHKEAPVAVKDPVEMPTKAQEELFFQRMHLLMEDLKFMNPQNPLQLHEDMRAIFYRAKLSDRDLRICFGLLAAVEVAIHGRPPRNRLGNRLGNRLESTT